MEENIQFSKSDFSDAGMNLTFEACDFLKSAGKWAGFLSILGFIGLGLMLLMALFLIMNPIYNAYMAGMGALIGVIYLVMVIIYFIPVYYLYQFSAKAKRALASMDTAELTNAMKFLKSHYKFMGIMMIVVLSIYVLMLLVGMIVGISSAF